MSLADNTADLNRLLGAAAEKIGKVRYCWLLTAAAAGESSNAPATSAPDPTPGLLEPPLPTELR